jgi:hypothetical protein
MTEKLGDSFFPQQDTERKLPKPSPNLLLPARRLEFKGINTRGVLRDLTD